MERDDLGSIRFWRESEQRAAQRFYVAFCLFVSAVQDAFLGLRERETGNLNWSGTCSYYSLVHGGRFLAFLAFGDLPMQHRDLADLFDTEAGIRARSHYETNGYPFDWLRKFVGQSAAPDADTEPNQQWVRENATHDVVIRYLQTIGVDDAEARVRQFGRMLGLAKPLRNDTNYEALLIAHEYRHQEMTQAFCELSSALSDAALTSLTLLRDAMRCMVLHDGDLDANRPGYIALARRYTDFQLREAVGRKLEHVGPVADLFF